MVTLELESGDGLDVRHFDIQESMSSGFTVAVIANGADDLDMASIKGKSASLALQTGTSGRRTWSGVVSNIAQTAVEPDGASSYSLIIAPGTGLMKKRKNQRIFKHQSAPDIARKILADWKIEPTMNVDAASHPQLEHRVQYGESDLAFLGRILHEAGIAYHFAQGAGGKSTMVLTDKPHEAEPTRKDLPFLRSSSLAEAQAHVSDVSIHLEVAAGKVTTRDHDFRRPNYKLGNTQTSGSGVESQNRGAPLPPRPLQRSLQRRRRRHAGRRQGGRVPPQRQGDRGARHAAAGGAARTLHGHHLQHHRLRSRPGRDLHHPGAPAPGGPRQEAAGAPVPHQRDRRQHLARAGRGGAGRQALPPAARGRRARPRSRRPRSRASTARSRRWWSAPKARTSTPTSTGA